MNVDVPLVKHVGGQPQPIGVGLEVLQRDHRGFLHDGPQIPRQGQLAFARREGRFDEEDVAATGRPSQASHHACHVVALVLVLFSGNAQNVVQVLCADAHLVGFLEGNLFGAVTNEFGQPLVQAPHPAFVRVLFHHRLDGGHGHLEAGRRKS